MFEYYTIAIISILGAASPGPDFVIVVKNALTHDRRSAIFTTLGITLGVLVHCTYCILGLALIISESPLLFNGIKYLGAGYLIYLGFKSLFSKSSASAVLTKQFPHTNTTALRSFRDGLLVNLLNPKGILFMLSVFTLVVKPKTPIWVQNIYALEIALVAFIWFTFLSLTLTHPAVKNKISHLQHLITKITGVVLLALGFSIVIKI